MKSVKFLLAISAIVYCIFAMTIPSAAQVVTSGGFTVDLLR